MTTFNRQKSKNNNLIAKVKQVSLGKRSLIFICSMGTIGAIAGSIDSKITFSQCLNSKNCVVSSDIAEQKVNRIGVGAVAGMIAASMLSLPALLDED